MTKFKVLLTPTAEAVGFNYQHSLIKLFDKIMSATDVRGLQSHSISHLTGKVIVRNNALIFPNGADWFVGFYQERHADYFAHYCIELGEDYNWRIDEFAEMEKPDFAGDTHRFMVRSPILIKRDRPGQSKEFIVFDNQEADFLLTESVRNKMRRLGIESSVELWFDHFYPKATTKLIEINSIKSRANLCPIFAKGTKKDMEYLWCCGAGHDCGAGFGALQ